ncbi:hypothetical protein BDN72DRAFT_806919 [Pluteus cervinus]|uniref:Uncharacterized protein n=1 Tax=Pluteus cervinus TaxID=181527 RepID=A0ACD3BFH8_9AGAR|nr:hypothetical protein BDN72DRAFT_806919 [Pluteus cervinus]
MAKGTKRASPGADAEKNPLQSVELSEEDATKLQNVQREMARAELVLEREAQKRLIPAYEKRREVLKSIQKFWPVALMNHNMVAFYVQHTADQLALSYLEDLWIAKDSKEPRCFTIELHFKENPYFTDKVLKKEYKYVPPESAGDEKPDADGITDSMLEFSWEQHTKASATKISWKDPEKALTKLYPRLNGDDDEVAEPGSFFNFFEQETDPFDIGLTIGNEIFPDAIDYFLGNNGGDELDSEDEDSDDDDDADEIDLEKPRAKKRRV